MNTWVFFICVFIIVGTVESMTGGWSPVEDLNSPDIQEKGRIATALVSESMDSEYDMKLVKILEGKKQVVAGMNYDFKLIIGSTECEKSANYTMQEIQDCSLQKCTKPYICNVRLWVQAWKQDKYQLTRSDCTEDDSELSC